MEKSEFYFQWHINDACNLRCKHCYHETYNKKELNDIELLNICNIISKALIKWNMNGRISLTGGEPFLSPNLFKIIDFLEFDNNIKQYDILTNGTLIDNEQIIILSKLKKLRQVQISLDGSNPSINDKIRGNGSFYKTYTAIKKMILNNIDISIMFTLTNDNKKDYLDIINFCENNNIGALTIERVTPCGNSSFCDVIEKYELKEIYEKITLRANDIKSKLNIRRLRPLWINTSYLDNRNLKVGGFCPVGYTSLAILHDGTVLPCRRLNIKLGNILEDGLYKIWYGSDILWNIRNKNNLNGKCNSCNKIDKCGGCRAIAYELTGDYMGEDVQCWI